jgi:ariadne-1
MESDEEEYPSDSGNESSDVDEQALLPDLTGHPGDEDSRSRGIEDEYHFEVLTTEQVLEHMVDVIQEVNVIVQLPQTVTRILLNHFKWDKEKLYERYYDGDRDRLFQEARIIDPVKTASTSRSATSSPAMTRSSSRVSN